ncbi:hypothetical protein C4552_03910 [Candidatus Parcubacteria bacterium]|nr:MAG: hypothetical protein C4552_03910 [Candidatus Parcubacteria bacterium]
MTARELERKMYTTITELATPEGILASARHEAFGAIFGRDTAVTVLKLLAAYALRPDPFLLATSRRALSAMIQLQGRVRNPESGEEPGKFIHEFRRDRHEHLTTGERPWYVYPDGTLRNYDSIDATPLVLIAFYRYWQASGDNQFLAEVLPAAEAALRWLLTDADADNDHVIEYAPPPDRRFGGLAIHSWTDSREALLQPDGMLPEYPIAPVEVQAFAWLALRLWAGEFSARAPDFAARLRAKADAIRSAFHEKFLFRTHGLWFAAQALDGKKRQIRTITANPLICLWAAERDREERVHSIVDDRYVPDFVRRAFARDLYDPRAGIRTMSKRSPTYNPGSDSYHNGSFWPMLNGLIFEGLMHYGYFAQARRLKRASLRPIRFFGGPIELYMRDKTTYFEYCSPSGQIGCRQQAWSAAAVLAMVRTKI